MRNLIFGFFILLYFLPGFIRAQNSGDSVIVFKGHMSIEELMNIDVVTPSRKPQKATLAPSIIHVINADDLRKYGVTSLIDALKYIPGCEPVMSSNGAYTISLRGMGKDGVILLLIDGQPFNNFYNGSAIFDLPVDFIEKIELIEGPASALYGTNAIAGVVNVITTKSSRNLIARGGAHGTYSGTINYFFHKDSFNLSTSAGYMRSNGPNQGIPSDKAELRDWSLTYKDKTGQTNRFLEDVFVTSTLNYKSLNIGLMALNRTRGCWIGPTFILAPDSKVKENQILITASNEFAIGDHLKITPLVYGSHIEDKSTLQEAPDGYKSLISGQTFEEGKIVKERYTGLKIGGELVFDIKASENFTISSRNIYEKQLLSDYDLSRNYKIVGDIYKGDFGNYDKVPFEQKDKSRDITAFCLNGDYKMHKLGITGGIRFDSYSDFGHTFNPRIGFVYPLDSNINLKLLYGSAFRAPTFSELYDNTTIGNEYGVKGNPDLKPETIKTAEFLADYSLKYLLVRATAYYSLAEDAISVYDPRGSGGIGKYENIGSVKGYGYSFETVISIGDKFKWFANFSQIFREFEWNPEIARNVDLKFYEKQPFCNRYLKHIPTIRVNSGLHFNYKKLELFVGFNYGYKSENNHRFYLEHARLVEIPEYYQGNYNLTYSISKNFKVFVCGNNIGDKYSAPEVSTNINAFGKKGLRQPDDTHLIGIRLNY